MRKCPFQGRIDGNEEVIAARWQHCNPCGIFVHSGDNEVWENIDDGTRTKNKEMLDDMHKRNASMADEIYVINVRGYIGSGTHSEII
jgi:hypothetical protein